MRGIDYSWARPGGAAIKAAGFEFVMRYVPYPGDGGKGLTVDEVADLRENGLAIGLVFESTAGRPLGTPNIGSFSAGQEDAEMAKAARDVLGFPDTLPIYFAVDFDAQPNQYPALDTYLSGAASVLFVSRVGVYGSYDVVKHCREAGTAPWSWQTYAWSGGRVYEGNHVYQYLNGQELNGGAVDYNDGTGAGLWLAEEDDMTPEMEARFAAIERRLDRIEADDTSVVQDAWLGPRLTAMDERITAIANNRARAAHRHEPADIPHQHATGGPE